MQNINKKSYNEILTETANFFASQGISIVGDGYKEIASNPSLLEAYVDQLTAGASADDTADMSQLMVNTNTNILRESSITGIQPIASLSMPVIRKLWPKFALKDAVQTEVVKTPRFVVSYTKPYMFRGDENGEEERIYIPKGLMHDVSVNGEHVHSDALRKEYIEKSVVVANGAAVVLDFTAESLFGNSNVKAQPLDEFIILEALVGALNAGKDGLEDGAEAFKIGKRLGIDGQGIYDIDGKGGQLVVRFDGHARKATVAVVGLEDGKAVSLKVKAGVSSEYNEKAWSVGFDIARQDIDIPSGQHINAPLPIEALNDMMALYQIDGTKETVDLMTNVFAQKLDVEILDFLTNSLANRPRNVEFADYGTANEFVLTFDCKPAAGFAGSPKAWREELKPLIDHLAQKIKNESLLQGGIFNIVANPLDVQLLENIDWSFRGGQGANVDGVSVDYSVGTYMGANAYKVIASTNVPQGAMYVVFLPEAAKQMTYKYYPYTFSTELGYIDPNRRNVPSIMMTARRTCYEFMPAIGAVLIQNNDGKGYFASYTSWKEEQ